MSQRLTVQFTIQPGKSAEFETFITEATAQVRAKDKGCEMYHAFKSLDDDTKYVLVESWASPEDLEAHGKSGAMAGMAPIREFLAGKTVMHRYQDED